MAVAAIRGQAPAEAFSQRQAGILFLLAMHLVLAFLFDKYNFRRRRKLRGELMPIVYTNMAMVALVSIVSVVTGFSSFSRAYFFGTLALVSIAELIAGSVISEFQRLRTGPGHYEYELEKPAMSSEELRHSSTANARAGKVNTRLFKTVQGTYIRQSIIDEMGPNVFEFLQQHVPLGSSSVVLSSASRINILGLPRHHFKTIVNLYKVNNHRYVNKYFEAVNMQLPDDGLYCGCCETKEIRKLRMMRHFGRVIGWPVYAVDYLIHRVMPKLTITRKLYFSVSGGRGRVLSRAELLGRLYSCGFEVETEQYVDRLLYFVARKVDKPAFDMDPTYGPLIKLNRLGKGGREISVYKIRTMHPYAEYLQHYVYEKNKLDNGGKFSDDFRIHGLGRLMRKYWIDEIPMLINLFRGDIKLVGVRPLSRHYFGLYTPELQERRTAHKPGLLPPYYADMPETLDDIMASEIKYLDDFEKNRWKTDCRYFFSIMKNILIKKARSK